MDGVGQSQVLVVVVRQHQRRHLVGHRGQQLVAVGHGQLAVLHLGTQQDLDVDLMVGGAHPGGVVDEVGVDPAPALRVLDPAQLGQAEVAALADAPGPDLIAVHPHPVVRLVPHLGMRLGGGLDVGADAAVPQQVDRRLEAGGDQLGRGQRVRPLGQAQRGPHRLSDRHRLGGPREHSAAGREQRGVVVGPAGPRQREQPRSLGPAALGVGVGVQEDVPVVERGNQLGVLAQQHAVAEHVAAHVTDADAGEVVGLRVHPHLPEVPLHRHPGAAGGDAHGLVVIAGRPARGERVAQPEAGVDRNLVGQVGEGRGALVGRDHQVRIVPVVAENVGRWHHGAVDDVVGHIQQAGDEQLIAGHALVQPGLPVDSGVGQPLAVETALGADRHDHRVLDHLRLDQSQNLGAEVLGPVRPAQPAAGHRPIPQVHPLQPRRVDEDLELRPRSGQVRDLAGQQLERDRPAGPRRRSWSVPWRTARRGTSG